jgi:hypothetical protein
MVVMMYIPRDVGLPAKIIRMMKPIAMPGWANQYSTISEKAADDSHIIPMGSTHINGRPITNASGTRSKE